MGNRKELSQEEYNFLTDAVADGASFASMADRLNVCTDTLKRILHRNGILEFEGAKFQTRSGFKMWVRPCMRCGDDKPRPKNQYICDPCTERMERGLSEYFGLEDDL